MMSFFRKLKWMTKPWAGALVSQVVYWGIYLAVKKAETENERLITGLVIALVMMMVIQITLSIIEFLNAKVEVEVEAYSRLSELHLDYLKTTDWYIKQGIKEKIGVKPPRSLRRYYKNKFKGGKK